MLFPYSTNYQIIDAQKQARTDIIRYEKQPRTWFQILLCRKPKLTPIYAEPTDFFTVDGLTIITPTQAQALFGHINCRCTVNKISEKEFRDKWLGEFEPRK